MSESKRLLNGTLVLTVGRVTGYGLSFLRNVILARVLAKADYGLAAVFGMAMILLEVGGRMAFADGSGALDHRRTVHPHRAGLKGSAGGCGRGGARLGT